MPILSKQAELGMTPAIIVRFHQVSILNCVDYVQCFFFRLDMSFSIEALAFAFSHAHVRTCMHRDLHTDPQQHLCTGYFSLFFKSRDLEGECPEKEESEGPNPILGERMERDC